MTRDAILAEIIELADLPAPQQPDEITIREFQEAAGFTTKGGQLHLDRLVEQGKLTKRMARVNGRQAWVYRKADVG